MDLDKTCVMSLDDIYKSQDVQLTPKDEYSVFTIEAEQLRRLSQFTSDDDTRLHLMGINIDKERAAATDGNTAIRTQDCLPETFTCDQIAIIPTRKKLPRNAYCLEVCDNGRWKLLAWKKGESVVIDTHHTKQYLDVDYKLEWKFPQMNRVFPTSENDDFVVSFNPRKFAQFTDCDIITMHFKREGEDFSSLNPVKVTNGDKSNKTKQFEGVIMPCKL